VDVCWFWDDECWSTDSFLLASSTGSSLGGGRTKLAAPLDYYPVLRGVSNGFSGAAFVMKADLNKWVFSPTVYCF